MSSQVTISTGTKRARTSSAGRATTKKTRPSRNVNVSKSIVSVGRTFPKKIRTVLRYVADVGTALNPSAGSDAQTSFKCNGMYDPYDPLGGHQPYGFDQYAAIYNHYHVYKSVCRVQWTCPNAYPEGFIVGLNITPGSSDSDTAQTKMEKQEGKINYAPIVGNAPRHTSIMTWKDKDYFGTSGDNDKLSAAVGADPTELSHFMIWCNNKNAVTAYCGALVTIDYYIEFTEPKSLGGS